MQYCENFPGRGIRTRWATTLLLPCSGILLFSLCLYLPRTTTEKDYYERERETETMLSVLNKQTGRNPIN